MLKFPEIKSGVLAIILYSMSAMLYSQNFVGQKEPDVAKYIKENMQNYSVEKDVVNSTYKYLKYSTADGLQTLIVFFNANSYCKEVRLSLDRSLYTSKVKELDSIYTKKSNSEWVEKKGRRQYKITMTDDKWYYTMKITEMK